MSEAMSALSVGERRNHARLSAVSACELPGGKACVRAEWLIKPTRNSRRLPGQKSKQGAATAGWIKQTERLFVLRQLKGLAAGESGRLTRAVAAGLHGFSSGSSGETAPPWPDCRKAPCCTSGGDALWCGRKTTAYSRDVRTRAPARNHR